jgi:hypothetical protein
MKENILKRIEDYRIDPLDEISEPPTYCRINEKPSLTGGNFSLICGKKKAGKTFLLGGIIASAINNSIQLGEIEGCLPEDKRNVLYFDTEQSTYHTYRSIKRICSLTGKPNPENLFAYGLRPLSPLDRLRVIEEVIKTTPDLGVVAIDGIRDLLARGINDEHEATTLTNLFLNWSSELNIHIILLLHQNKNDFNARGHIGSEVVNKAETIISVSKADKADTFVVSCADSRDVSFDDFYFTISDDGLPIASDMPEVNQTKITDPGNISNEKHIDHLRNIFKSVTELNYENLCAAIKKEFAIGKTASEKYCKYYRGNNLLENEHRGGNTFYKFTKPLYLVYPN